MSSISCSGVLPGKLNVDVPPHLPLEATIGVQQHDSQTLLFNALLMVFKSLSGRGTSRRPWAKRACLAHTHTHMGTTPACARCRHGACWGLGGDPATQQRVGGASMRRRRTGGASPTALPQRRHNASEARAACRGSLAPLRVTRRVRGLPAASPARPQSHAAPRLCGVKLPALRRQYRRERPDGQARGTHWVGKGPSADRRSRRQPKPGLFVAFRPLSNSHRSH